MTDVQRIVVCGYGSIGRRHAANLRTLLPDARITVLRQHSKTTRATDLPSENVKVVYSLEDALAADPQAVLICNPAPYHVRTAQAFADAGAHIFMEKPISDRVDGIDHLINTCARHELTFLIAYPLRFDTALNKMREAVIAGEIGSQLSISAAVGQYLPDWRPEQDYREGVTAQKALGGGVLLELSHELDYVQWIMGPASTVEAKISKLSDLEIDVEDTADLTLGFSDGATGTVHLDMTSKSPIRSCRVSGTLGVAEWDGLKSTAHIKSNEDNEWRELSAENEDGNSKFVTELKHFFACISGDETEMTTAENGKQTLELILAARRSSSTGRTVTL